MTGRRLVRTLGLGAVLAAPYVPFVLGWTPRFDLLGMILVTAAAMGAPGLAAVVATGRRRAAEVVTVFVLGGWALCLVAMALRIAFELPLTAAAFAEVLGIITCAAGLWGATRPGALPFGRPDPAVVAAAALGFAVSFFAARSIVPPLQDQDMDAQDTAYGLAVELTPVGLTDRSTLYFFAHPLLLHYLNSCTLLLTGEIEVVRPAYDAAVLERSRLPAAQQQPGVERALDALRRLERPPDRDLPWKRSVYGAFLRDPALFGTRAPNVVFAAALAALLFVTLGALGLSRLDAGLVTLATVTLPEIVVRSGYGGYFAPTALTFLVVARLASDPGTPAVLRAAAGFLAMFTNQKAVTVGAAVLGSEVLGRLKAIRPAASGSLPLLGGMVAAAGAYALFGLAIAPQDFVLDNLLEHGVWRFAAAAGKTGARLDYPGPLVLWGDFARQSGWGWSALVVAGWVAAPRRLLAARESDEGGRLLSVAWLWALAAAVVFTATDWRQTKHLCTMLPALVILVGSMIARPGGGWRIAGRAVLVASIAWNVVRIAGLAQHFNSFPVRPIW